MEYLGRSIPTAVKRAVLARDGMVCVWCGYAVVEGVGHAYRPDRIHFDHVIPFAAGGNHGVDNLVVSCARCNLSRPRPKASIREMHARIERRHGRYWWSEGYEPPRLADPLRCATELGACAQELRQPVERVVHLIHRGVLPATGPGEAVHVEMPDAPPPGSRPRRKRRRGWDA